MKVLHPVAQAILEKRGIEDVEAFLSPDYDARPDPYLMKDMDVAVARILKAIKGGEKIAAWTDYDCDGIPAGALLAEFFKMIEYPLRSYIPDRSEGYSLNKDGITKLKDEGITLIITADCGITDIDEVAYATSLGIDVIVTDHHLPLSELPSALAVLNPHRTDNTYPFTELCGTGVAFKMAEALVQKGSFDLKDGQLKWLLDLVALATIADMVSLTGENRILAHWGLVVMRKGRRPGLKALLEAQRIPLTSLTETDIAFSVAPKINAASRMESPLLGLEILTTESPEKARELAATLVKLNGARKLEGARVGKEVKHRLEGAPLSSVVVLGNSEWKPSLLGIAATGVVETYQRTVFLWGREPSTNSGQEGLIKGSCRSDGTVNVVELMAATGHLFEDYGGHELSGGFSLKSSALLELPQALCDAYDGLRSVQSAKPPLEAHNLTLAEVTDALYDSLRMLAPFGMDNAQPLFAITARVERVLKFGGGKEHARLTISDEQGNAIDAVSFFFGRTSFRNTLELLSPGDKVALVASLERSYFGNKKELRLRVEDISL